jgi:multiple sugar transport system permease protein
MRAFTAFEHFSLDRLKEHRLAWVFLSPGLLLLALIVLGPLVYSLFLSLHEEVVTGGQFSYTFVGLRHYIILFKSSEVHQILAQTFLFTFLRLGIIFIVGMLIALLINHPLAPAGLFKRLFLIPWALPRVVTALVWGWMFNAQYGVINALLQGAGLISDYRSWLGDPNIALYAVTFVDAWQAVPFIALMLLAGLQSIPQELYDAAAVDGANAWAMFRYITLPSLRPVILVTLVIQTMWSLKTFTIIWALTKGGPMNRSMILNVYAYQQTFRYFKFGHGAAVAWIVTILILTLTIIYIRLLGFEG